MPEAWLPRWLGAVLLAVGLLAPARAEVLRLREAQVVSTVEGVRQESAAPLPYNWDRLHHGRPGQAVFDIRFGLPEPSEKSVSPYGLYFPRVGNRAEIWLNGTLLSRYGEIGAGRGSDYAKTPLYLLLPPWLLRQDNVLRVVIEADGGRLGGLWIPVIGPDEEVRGVYQSDYRWRVTASLAVAVFSLVVGCIALLLWLTQRNPVAPAARWRDPLYLSAGLAELFWVVRLSDFFLEEPPLSWLGWRVLQVVAYAGWTVGAGLFAHHVAGWDRHPSMPWVKRVAWGVMLTAAPVAYVAVNWNERRYLTLWYGLLTLMFVAYLVFYLWSALRKPFAEHLLLAVAGVLNVAAGVRDWLVIQAGGDVQAGAWIRYSSVLFGMALLYIVVTRFRRTSEQARDLMDNMAARVKEKEQELAVSYRELEQVVREQERTAERARILRDMHDGVGAHISSAIRQLQSGHAGNDQLLQTLRDSLDQLKLSIDAMNLPPGDVTALLANLRYRLGPRLAASDIELVWAVEEVAPLASLDVKAMRQLQFMVFEAVSNVLQHAQASRLTLELRANPGAGATLRVIDNGQGFDAGRSPRRGVSSLRERATAIGAGLNIASTPAGTTVEIVLP